MPLNYWKSFLDAAPDALFLVDASGLIRYASAQAERLFGYERQELIDQPVELLVPEQKRERHRANRHAYAAAPDVRAMSQRGALHALRKDGTTFPAHISLSPISVDGQTQVIASVRDITELEETRRKLANAGGRLRELIDNIPDAVAVHRNGTLVYGNQALADYLLYDDPSELVGTPIMEILHPDDRPLAAERVTQMLATGEKAPPIEERFVRRDGTTIAAEVHVQPMDFEGKPSFVVIGRDISHKQALLARAMQMDRKLAVGTLATGVAHEINNPLAYAKSNVDFALAQLRRALQDPAAIDEKTMGDLVDGLADAAHGLDRIARVVNDLDTFVDYHDGELSEVDLTAVLETAINLVFRRLASRAHVSRELRNVPKVRANRGQLAETFINLLTNASQAVEDDGDGPAEVRIITGCTGSEVFVEIADTGCGISEENLAHVFDPFFSTRSTGEGTGLGLTTARNTIENLDGRMEMESTEGEGTTVRIWLPAIGACDEADEPDTQSMVVG